MNESQRIEDIAVEWWCTNHHRQWVSKLALQQAYSPQMLYICRICKAGPR